MLLADNHFTPIIGIDLHFTTMPPWNPFHPFIGMVLDPFDYVPFIGGTVHVNGIKRGISHTYGIIIPLVHIPLFTPPWVMTPIIGHESMNFFASQNVFADGSRFSPKGHMVMTCNDIGIPLTVKPGKMKIGKKLIPFAPTLFAPTSMSLPIPTGAPVNLGGPYVPDWTGALVGLLMSFGFGALMKAGRKLFNKMLKKMLGPNKLSKSLCHGGFEPVNLVNGAVYYEGTDFELPGPLPLQWERNWYSDSPYRGWLGHGVHCRYDRCVELYPEEGAIGLRMEDGRGVAFPLLEIGEEFYLRQEKITLKREKQHFEAFDHNTNLTYYFEQYNGYNTYRLTRMENPAGFRVRLLLSGDRLTGIVDSAGRKIRVESDMEGRIHSMELETPNGGEPLVSYGYDDKGNLTEITDALGKTTGMVYENHLMVRKTDRNGQTFYWEYDGKKTGARCIHTWGDGGLQEGHIAYFPEKGYNEVTDANGAVTTYYYTPEQLVTQIKDPLGNSRFFEYTEFMEPYREIDEEGFTTGYTYDDRGNRTAVVQPDGSSYAYFYDEQDRLTTTVDPEGNQTVYTYKKDNPLFLNSVIEPDNGITSYEYNKEGLLNQVRKGKQKTLMEYDKHYNLVAIADEGGQRTEWKYDHRGRVKLLKAPGSNSQHFEYDALDRVTRIKTADRNQTRLSYNAYDEVVEAVDNHRHVRFAYTPMGSLAMRQENGTKVHFAYDAMEQLLSITNEHNERYRFDRNAKGDIIKEYGFDGLERSYHRDNAGRVIRLERPADRWTEYEHDALGRITRAEYYDGSWETYTYNKSGQLVEARNSGLAVSLERDSMGRVVKETQTHIGGKGIEVLSTYDKNGNRTGLSSSLGADIQNEYDHRGFLSRVKAKSETLGNPWEAGIKRNALGQEVERVVTGGITSSFRYDGSGMPVQQRIRNRKRETYNRHYVWDANQQLMQVINGIQGGMTMFTYDAFGNLASARYEDGSYDYKLPDEVGNLYRDRNRSGRKYGPGGKLLKDKDWHYKYDEEGNLIAKTGAKGTWKYHWQGNGMLKGVETPEGKEIAFEYDPLGRRTAKITGNRIFRYLWDGNVLLHEWDYRLDERPGLVANELGELSLDREEPVPVEKLVTWVYEDGSFTPSAKLIGDKRYSIFSDYLGRPVQAYDDTGELVWETEHNIYGELKDLKGNRDFIPFRQPGQYEDGETGLYYNRFRYYSPESGTYISQDPVGLMGNNPNFYGYVYNANSEIDPYGLIIVYRALNGGQEASALAGEAINPKDINANYTIQQHIDDGKLQTQYISTTKKKKTAQFYAKPNPKRGKITPSTIIQIDTDKLNPAKVFDMSSGLDPQTGKNLEMPAFRYATKDAEVLIEGPIPKGAYKICK